MAARIIRKLSYDQKVRLLRQFVYKVRLDDKGAVELELYKTPQSDVPQNFRSFPKELRSKNEDYKGSTGSGSGSVWMQPKAVQKVRLTICQEKAPCLSKHL